MWQLNSAIATLTLGLSASVAFAAGPFGSIHVGNWVGGAFTNDQTGVFSDCRASSEDQDKNSITVDERSNGTMVLGLADVVWHLRPKERFPIAITFDDRAHFQLSATATADGLAEARVPNKAFLAWFIKSHLMIVRTKTQALQWHLTYPDRLLATIANCVAKMRYSGIANAGDFSVSAATVPDANEASIPIEPESQSAVAIPSPVAVPSPPLSVPAPIGPEQTPITRPPVAASFGEPNATGTIESLAPGSRPTIPNRTAGPTFGAIETTTATHTAFDLTGMGIVIDSAGYVITANHVVSRCEKGIQGNLSGEGDMTLRVVSTDETNDLALLQAQRKFKYNGMLRESAILVGDLVLAFGYSAHSLPGINLYTATGFVSSLSGNRNDTRFLQISLPTRFEGEGGGPLLDTKGDIVGLMTEGIGASQITSASDAVPKNVALAVKSGALRNFLDNSPVAYQVADARMELEVKQIVDRATAYTLLVTCR